MQQRPCAVEKPDDSEIGSPEDYAALAAEAERAQTITIRGREGWLFFGPELRHIGVGPFWGEDAARVSRARKPENADPLPAILDFKRQLDTIGVELILIPVPPKSIVYADMLASNLSLPSPPPRLDPAHQLFYELLRSEDVTVIDLTEIFLDNRSHPEGPVYCRQDTHWSGCAFYLFIRAHRTGLVSSLPASCLHDFVVCSRSHRSPQGSARASSRESCSSRVWRFRV